MSGPQHDVLLVPGLLGFQRVGSLRYFAEAEDILRRELLRVGLPAEVTAIKMLPTSSLRARAARLAEIIAARDPNRTVHLVGHSTGGLDSRLMMTPGASLEANADVESVAARVASVVCIATPHHGTPLASFCVGVQGHRLIGAASGLAMRTLKLGRAPFAGAQRLGEAVFILNGLSGLQRPVRDRLYDQLRTSLPEDRVGVLEQLLDEIGDDSSLLEQLTPSSAEVLNAATGDRSTARYGSVVVRAPAPGIRSTWRVGADPYAQATHALYQWIHRITARFDGDRLPRLTEAQHQALCRGFGSRPSNEDNDGIIPTLSQVRGTVIHCATADHLDVMGHFAGRGDPRHADWLASGSRYTRRDFEAAWRDIAAFIAQGC